MLHYSAVIATRNRPDALAMSLPLLLAQSRKPAQVFVVDSSDDPSANADMLVRQAQASGIAVAHLISAPGTSLQRNLGLAQVGSEIVFLPDDDSLVHPGAMEAVMRIYERDMDKRIGAVGPVEARKPPAGVLEHAETYRMDRRDRIKTMVGATRYRLEARFVRDPMILAANRLLARQPARPGWLAEEAAAPVPWITGFRMSFRTEALRRRSQPFCEALGRYALLEDVDACMGVARQQLVVSTGRAQVFHHRMPGQRSDGRTLGVMHMLNRAFVLRRAGPCDDQIRRLFRRFAAYKLALYALDVPTGGAFARERLAGARVAASAAPALFDASAVDCTTTYLSLRAACMAD